MRDTDLPTAPRPFIPALMEAYLGPQDRATIRRARRLDAIRNFRKTLAEVVFIVALLVAVATYVYVTVVVLGNMS